MKVSTSFLLIQIIFHMSATARGFYQGQGAVGLAVAMLIMSNFVDEV